MTDKTKALVEAAKAVIERWDSPNWGGKNLEHTADYINRLRKTLAAFKQPTIREMTVDEVANHLLNEVHVTVSQHMAFPVILKQSNDGSSYLYEDKSREKVVHSTLAECLDKELATMAAKTLAKLGAIRVIDA